VWNTALPHRQKTAEERKIPNRKLSSRVAGLGSRSRGNVKRRYTKMKDPIRWLCMLTEGAIQVKHMTFNGGRNVACKGEGITCFVMQVF
jgi:hypothetical protein